MRHPHTYTPSALGLVADEQELPEVVIGYFNNLRRVPVGQWAAVARDAVDSGNDAAAAAHASLRRVVSRVPGLAVQTQRRVQNLVEIAATCLPAADASAMRRVALGAALALATRSLLGDESFTLLYEPFASLIPLDDLPGLAIERMDADWSEAGARAPLAQTA